MAEKTCPSCGKQFTPWRGKTYCSEACRKRAENRRLRGDKTAEEGIVPDAQNDEENDQQNQRAKVSEGGMVTPEDGAFVVRSADWIAINDITDKLQYKGTAVGWTMYIEPVEGYTNGGWFGRVGNLMKFGPTSRARARSAVEAYLAGQLFQKKTANASKSAVVGG